MHCTVPVEEQIFAMRCSGQLGRLSRLPSFHEVEDELVAAILTGASALANDTFAPLNAVGDREGAHWSPSGVSLPDGFAPAYRKYVEGGWGGLSVPAHLGGQGLPRLLGVAVQEQFASANMAFQ